jgi:SAM-dependent methyltransferase
MPRNFYGPALASLHKKRYEQLSVRRARHLLALFRRHGVRRGSVVDLACGAGGWARELARRGYAVTGVDISPAMIALARKRAPRARFFCASMTRVPLPPCDAVTALGEAFNYVRRPADVRRTFRRVFRALRPGGVFVFDTLEPPRRARLFHRFHAMGGRGRRLEAHITEYPRRRLVVRAITVREGKGPGRRVAREVHRQRTYSGKELAAWLRRCGFRARVIRDPRLQLWERHVAVLGRKR